MVCTQSLKALLVILFFGLSFEILLENFFLLFVNVHRHYCN